MYRARQTNLDREVVVKTISREYLAELDGDEEYIQTELERFHREAWAIASVRHPYIVQVYDQDEYVITTGGKRETVQYLTVEYIDGPSLRSTMPADGFCGDEKRQRAWIRQYFLPILDGIQAIHDLGIVHGDIKPESVLLDRGAPKIMGFGIAGGARWSGLTKSHHVEGAITYMAPELVLGETDVRGDVYALGKVLYESIIGKLDKKTDRPLKPVNLACTDTPFWKRLDLIIRDATAEDPQQRTASVSALKMRLEKLLDDFDESKLHVMGLSPPRLSRKQIALGVAGIALVVALIVISNPIDHAVMVRETGQSKETLAEASQDAHRHGGRTLATEQRGKTALPSRAIGNDGSTLRLVPGGKFTIPSLRESEGGASFRVAPVYMGETEVTNAQYVSFLNQVLARISIVNGAVQSEGTIWLALGEVFRGYEPIVFQDGEFSVKDPQHSTYPVVHVTGSGAVAYARFYGARLPTELEWYAAVAPDKDSAEDRRKMALKSDSELSDLEREMVGLVEAYGALDEYEVDL